MLEIMRINILNCKEDEEFIEHRQRSLIFKFDHELSQWSAHISYFEYNILISISYCSTHTTSMRGRKFLMLGTMGMIIMLIIIKIMIFFHLDNFDIFLCLPLHAIITNN